MALKKNSQYKNTAKILKQKLKELDRISEMLNKVRQSLADEVEGMQPRKGKVRLAVPESFPSDNELKEEYDRLLNQYDAQGVGGVQEFVQQHTSLYLQRFFRANNLPIPKRHGKQEMARLLSGHLTESRIIRGT